MTKTLKLTGGAVIAVMVFLGVEGYRLHAALQDTKFSQTLAKIQQAETFCEADTAAVDKKTMDDAIRGHELFCSSPRGVCSANVLQLELKMNMDTHKDRLRDCVRKREIGQR